jgi:indole-3-glycerol phosphate synthase
MTDFLEQLIAERRAAITARRAELPPEPYARDTPRSLHAAIDARRRQGRLAVIAEVKRISPALGVLVSDLDPAAQARRYVAGGATAISVLTEPNHWGGSLADLAAVRDAVGVPVLCKDVIVDEYQIDEAVSAGADAVLLIAEALTDDELRRFLARCRTFGIDALVEAHEPVAFGRAVRSGAAIVGANARDLRHPEIIDRGRARLLHTFVPRGRIFVAESGIASAQDIVDLPGRVDAVLVGTALMRALDPAALVRAMASVRRPIAV